MPPHSESGVPVSDRYVPELAIVEPTPCKEADPAILFAPDPSVTGDCSSCGHSIIYHLPLVGCTRCNCDEFH